MNEKQNHHKKINDSSDPKEDIADKNEEKIDVLNLPPRKDVHSDDKRTQLKWSKPFLRLLSVVVILFLLLVVYVYLVLP